ncbi:TPA: hypothetical protein MBS28_003271 [Klebsiella aerogenes]|nr:hypothetical protein [Klebsiella aerogenes]
MNNENKLTAALLTIEKSKEASGCPAGVDLQDWVKQLAESRTVTVKLPDYRHERFWDSRCEEFNPVEYQVACIEMWREELTAKGIKWEAE